MSAAFTLEETLAATGGELMRVGSCTRFPGVSTDSRTLAADELFVALRGATHDGHVFAPEAAAHGAGAVLVEPEVGRTLATGGVIMVRDTLVALGRLAHFHRCRSAVRVVAITGSNGKTTTKEMLAAILESWVGGGGVLHTAGNLNNLVGLPLTLLRLGSERLAILEAGMNAPGEIWELAGIADPDVGVITCVAPAHLEGLGSVRNVAQAKGELYRRLRPDATAVVNADDPLVTEVARDFTGRKLTFGRDASAVVRATALTDDGLEGVRFQLGIDGASTRVHLPVPGQHNVTNALAAAAAAHALGVPYETIAVGLARFRPANMRMQVMHLPSGVTVINDAYNANPASMAAALHTLATSRATRRFAALGEMRELGTISVAAHEELGRLAAAAHLDGLFLLGEHAAVVRAGAITAGMAAERIVVAAGHAELADGLRTTLGKGDVLLLKGSRGAEMEKALAPLGGEGLH